MTTSFMPRKSAYKAFSNLIMLFLLSFISITLSAQIPSTFCDGNPADLANFTTTYPIHGYVLDVANAASNADNSFGTGAKDESPISTGTPGKAKAATWNLGNTNNKGDLTNAGAALTGTNNCILRFFGDRTSESGNANIGFWFYVSPVSTNANGTFSGTHTDGDLFIVSSFTSGGTQPTIKVYTWQGNGLVAVPLTTTTSYCAAVNQTAYPVPAGFTYTTSSGGTQYAPNLFFEGAIDLCSLDINSCFASFLLETRNSQTLDAALQDFALGSFNATPPTPAATVSQPTCTVATGTVTITGYNSAYTYTLTGPGTSTTAVHPNSSGVFTAVAPGTYSLTTTQGTCTSSPATVVVNTPPPTPATPAANVVQPTCTVATGTITVTSPLGAGLTYSIGGTFQSTTTFSLVAPGTYTLTVKNSSGCTNTSTVVVNPAPSTPAQPTVTIIEPKLCPVNGVFTATVTVTCPIGAGFQYSNNGGAYQTSPIFSGLAAGSGFSITVKNSAGCVSAATNCSNYTTVPACTNPASKAITAAPLSNQTSVKAAPNPFNDRVKFSFNSAVSGQGSLDLYNMLGQKVKTVYQGYIEKGKHQTIEYSVPNALRTNLIYMFRVGNERKTGKLIGLK